MIFVIILDGVLFFVCFDRLFLVSSIIHSCGVGREAKKR